MNAMLHLLRILLTAALLAFCTFDATADGGAFKRMVEDPTTANMPDQRAILAFSKGIETLAIQTRFEGNPAEFAWVVPLPSVPTVTACTHGTFKTMPALMARRVVSANEPPLWLATGMLALALAIAHASKWRFHSMVAIAFTIFAIVIVLLPALGKARSAAGSPVAPSPVIRSEEIGNYEVTTLSSRSPTELIDWLQSHGFGVGEPAKAAIAAYVRDGWVFVASRASRAKLAANGGTITPHALTFEFPTESPVYPMRLTGANNSGPLSVSLYVFGSGTASAPGWKLRHSDHCEFPPTEDFNGFRYRYPTSPIVVSHQGIRTILARHASGPLHATHLTRTFAPEDMHADVPITFGEATRFQEKVYTHEAAMGGALNWGTFAGLVMVLGSIGIHTLLPAVGFGRLFLGCLAGGAIVTGSVFAATSRTTSIVSYRQSQTFGRDLESYAAWEEVWKAPDVGPVQPSSDSPRTREDVLAVVKAFISESWPEDGPARPIEEDSPGNYVVERIDDHWAVRVFDLLGQEKRVVLPESSPPPQSSPGSD